MVKWLSKRDDNFEFVNVLILLHNCEISFFYLTRNNYPISGCIIVDVKRVGFPTFA